MGEIYIYVYIYIYIWLCCIYIVRLNSDLSGAFLIINGVKQGWVLALILFSIFFSFMLKHALEDLDHDVAVYIHYHLDSSLFKLRRLHAYTKTLEQLFRDLLFVDDTALVAITKRALQHLTSCFAEAIQLFRTQGQLEEDWGPPPACNPRRVLPSPHHHWCNWADISSPVHLPWVYHHIRHQDQLGSRQ